MSLGAGGGRGKGRVLLSPSPTGSGWVTESEGSVTVFDMENAAIVERLTELGDLLEIQGANPFRVRAYRNAVRTIQGLTRPLTDMVGEEEDLTALPGIGKEMAEHIRELVREGRLTLLEEVAAEVPRSLATLTQLDGLGPKKAARLWKELGVTTVDELEKVLEAGKVAELAGFGVQSAERLRHALEDHRRYQGRFRRDQARKAMEPLLAHLREAPELERLEVAGSWRRGRETVGDIDLLAVVSGDRSSLMRRFVTFDGVVRVEGEGETRGSVVLEDGLPVDLRILPPESFGAALHYFTGSKEHNVEVRRLARERGLKVSEYGVFRVPEGISPDELGAGEGERVGGAEEEEIFAAVDLPWIDPALRENRGEFEAARNGTLPTLVAPEDIRGDLHMHTTWSDGANSVLEMARACREMGYAYMAITDHSRSLAMANGLTQERLREQWDEIESVREAVPELLILRGSEVDILKDGSLDFDDEVLEELDIVLAAVHTHFELGEKEQTERILRAIAHPLVDVLVHPTGRLINRREPYPVDMEAVLAAAKEHDVAVELNANPRRLDLHDRYLFRARELGVQVLVNTDAHRIEQLDYLAPGLDQARRGWLTAADVVNTRDRDALAAWLSR